MEITFICCSHIEENYYEWMGRQQELEYKAEQRKLDMLERHRCDCCDEWVDRHEDLTTSGDDVLCEGCAI